MLYSPVAHRCPAVTPETSIEDVHSVLQRRGALPDWAPAQRPYFFAPLGLRRSPISWNDTVGSLGLNSLSTLQLCIRLPGGSSKLLLLGRMPAD